MSIPKRLTLWAHACLCAEHAYLQNIASICKELLKQVVSGIDTKYGINDLTMVEHIKSVLSKSEVDAVLQDLHPNTDWDIFHSWAMVVIGVSEEGQRSCDPRHKVLRKDKFGK